MKQTSQFYSGSIYFLHVFVRLVIFPVNVLHITPSQHFKSFQSVSIVFFELPETTPINNCLNRLEICIGVQFRI